MVQADEFSCFILGKFFECFSDSQTVKQKANRGFHTAVIDQYFQTGWNIYMVSTDTNIREIFHRQNADLP